MENLNLNSLTYALLVLPYMVLEATKGLFCLMVLTFLWRTFWIILGRCRKLPVASDQVILVTGAASGIGLAVCKHLHSLGYHVIATYRSQSRAGYAELLELASRQTERANQLILYQLDVTNESSIRDCYQMTSNFLLKNNFKLHALINNAGISTLQPFSWMDRNYIRHILHSNLEGSMMMAREFIPLLIQAKGRLINVSSGLGYIPGPAYIPYGVTKAGQIYFTRALNTELAQYGVKSIVVAPANFIKHTEINSGQLQQLIADWDRMSQTERNVYEKEFEHYYEKMKSLDDKIKSHHKSMEAYENSGKSASFRSCWVVKLFNSLIDVTTGSSRALTLEESGLLDTFEDAVRARSPFEHIFAGDNLYNILAATLFLSMPMSMSNFMGKIIGRSLYN